MLPTRLLSALGALWLAATPIAQADQPVRTEIGGGWSQADTMRPTLIPFPGDVVAVPDITAALRAASPINFVDATDPPMLLLHGERDQAVSVKQSRMMQQKLQEVGVRGRLVEYAGADHGWMSATPDATREVHLKALQVAFDFFDETIEGKK